MRINKGVFMKSLLGICLVAFSSFSYAATISYNGDSVLPYELRTLVEAAIEKNCDVNSYNLIEVLTTVEARRYDQNLKDYYYTSTFALLNEQNEHVTSLVVESHDQVPGNGTESLGVSSLKTTEGSYCK